MTNGDRWVLVTAAGKRVEYVVDGGVSQHGDLPEPVGGLVRLRNPMTGGYARIYIDWLHKGASASTSAHWEKVA